MSTVCMCSLGTGLERPRECSCTVQVKEAMVGRCRAIMCNRFNGNRNDEMRPPSPCLKSNVKQRIPLRHSEPWRDK